jgi:hypothetical protein
MFKKIKEILFPTVTVVIQEKPLKTKTKKAPKKHALKKKAPVKKKVKKKTK